MPQLDKTYAAYSKAIDDADAIWSADIAALNSSGAKGDVLFMLQDDADGGTFLHVAVTASGLAPSMTHLQHIHGMFDAAGNPANSVSPTLALDGDRDGMVEVLEGLAAYGDILLPLSDEDGAAPVANDEGYLTYFRSFDVNEDSNFFSPVTGSDYTFEDLMALALREYVIHGVTVPDGIGTGTGGEVDGGVNGFIPILPAGVSEIVRIDAEQARTQIAGQQSDAGTRYVLDGGDSELLAGDGKDFVLAGAGDDSVSGGGGSDVIQGLAGNDILVGDDGDDVLNGGSGDDMLRGGVGDDNLLAGLGDDVLFGGAGDDGLVGGSGDDVLRGLNGNDLLAGGAGDDVAFGNAGTDRVFGAGGDDRLSGGTGDDNVGGGNGDDMVFGGAGDDFMGGAGGRDLVVGGAGDDILFGGNGADILGGGMGDDRLTGGAGADEFHFDAGTGSDVVNDFQQGVDVISFLDGGAISFANSEENDTRGDSDLAGSDFDRVLGIAGLEEENDQQVVFSFNTAEDAMTSEADVAVEAYLAASDGTDTFVYHDDDWSTLEGRETVAVLDGFSAAMTQADFDVY